MRCRTGLHDSERPNCTLHHMLSRIENELSMGILSILHGRRYDSESDEEDKGKTLRVRKKGRNVRADNTQAHRVLC